MSQGKKAERSRLHAKQRRTEEAKEISDIADQLPLALTITKKLDKGAILRLALTYLRLKHLIGTDAEDADNINLSVKEGELMLESFNGFFIVISSKSEIVFVSENVERHMGISQVDMLGKDIYEFVLETDHRELKKQFMDRSQGNTRVHGMGLSSSGNTIEMDVNFSEPIPSGSEPGFEIHRQFFLRMKCSYQRRCTQAKLNSNTSTAQSEFILLQWSGYVQYDQEGKMSYLAAVARPLQPTPIMELKMDGNMFISRHSLDLYFMYCDPRLSTMLGYEPDEISGSSMYQYHHPGDLEMCGNCHSNLMTAGTSISKYYRFLSKNNEWCWLQTRATIVYNTTKQPQYIVCMNYIISEKEGKRYLMEYFDKDSSSRSSSTGTSPSSTSTQSAGSATSSSDTNDPDWLLQHPSSQNPSNLRGEVNESQAGHSQRTQHHVMDDRFSLSDHGSSSYERHAAFSSHHQGTYAMTEGIDHSPVSVGHSPVGHSPAQMPQSYQNSPQSQYNASPQPQYNTGSQPQYNTGPQAQFLNPSPQQQFDTSPPPQYNTSPRPQYNTSPRHNTSPPQQFIASPQPPPEYDVNPNYHQLAQYQLNEPNLQRASPHPHTERFQPTPEGSSDGSSAHVPPNPSPPYANKPSPTFYLPHQMKQDEEAPPESTTSSGGNLWLSVHSMIDPALHTKPERMTTSLAEEMEDISFEHCHQLMNQTTQSALKAYTNQGDHPMGGDDYAHEDWNAVSRVADRQTMAMFNRFREGLQGSFGRKPPSNQSVPSGTFTDSRSHSSSGTQLTSTTGTGISVGEEPVHPHLHPSSGFLVDQQDLFTNVQLGSTLDTEFQQPQLPGAAALQHIPLTNELGSNLHPSIYPERMGELTLPPITSVPLTSSANQQSAMSLSSNPSLDELVRDSSQSLMSLSSNVSLGSLHHVSSLAMDMELNPLPSGYSNLRMRDNQ